MDNSINNDHYCIKAPGSVTDDDSKKRFFSEDESEDSDNQENRETNQKVEKLLSDET